MSANGSTAPDTCPDCEGRGWIVSADGANGLARLCECRAVREPLSRLEALTLVGAPEIPRTVPFVPPAPWPDPALATWCGIPWAVTLGSTERGTGKTVLATELMWRVLQAHGDRPRTGTWVRASQVPDIFFGGGDGDRERRAEGWARLVVAPVVLIDDLGAGHPRGQWEALTELICLREPQDLPTLITTNLPSQDIRAAAPSLWDRLRTGVVAQMPGKSRRRRRTR